METWNSYNYSSLHSSLCYQHSLSPQEISKTKRKITKLRKLPLSNSFPLFTGITFVDVSPFQNRLCQYLLANASRTNSPFLDYEVPDIWYFLLTFVCKLLGFLAVSFTRTGHHNKVIFPRWSISLSDKMFQGFVGLSIEDCLCFLSYPPGVSLMTFISFDPAVSKRPLGSKIVWLFTDWTAFSVNKTKRTPADFAVYLFCAKPSTLLRINLSFVMTLSLL